MTVLVLCRDQQHAKMVEEALALPDAKYVPWTTPLAGYKFKKVIWLVWQARSDSEEREMNRVLREVVPTKLEPGCQVYVL